MKFKKVAEGSGLHGGCGVITNQSILSLLARDINFIGLLTDAELKEKWFDGSSPLRSLQPHHVPTLCEREGVDEKITNAEAAWQYGQAIQDWRDGLIDERAMNRVISTKGKLTRKQIGQRVYWS